MSNSKMKGMYFLCTIHPELEETKSKGYVGGYMTLEEKKEAIDNFYKTDQNIALSMQHKTKDKNYGSFIPRKEKVGKILDLFNDKDGDLIAKCILYKDTNAFNIINEGFHINKEKWGVSVRIDWCMLPGADKIEKKITHLALTLSPYFADRNTYIHHWSTNEKSI